MVAFWIAATKSDQLWSFDKRKTPVDVFYEDFFVPRPVILIFKTDSNQTIITNWFSPFLNNLAGTTALGEGDNETKWNQRLEHFAITWHSKFVCFLVKTKFLDLVRKNHPRQKVDNLEKWIVESHPRGGLPLSFSAGEFFSVSTKSLSQTAALLFAY